MICKRMRARLSISLELLTFLYLRKKWWIAPIVIALLSVALTGMILESSAAAPFIYTLF